MATISLTSDWHHRDYYLGAVKGRLLSLCPGVQLVDLSHNVDNYNISQTAFILKNSFHHFPKGTIHIIGLNSEKTDEHQHIAIKYKEHYFIGADNGLFCLALKGKPDEIVMIENIKSEEEYLTFPELNIFTKAAAHIVKHNSISDLGPSLAELNRLIPIRALIQKGTVTGQIIYIDSYGNATTNISKELFESARQKRDFEILIQSNHYRISTINKNYHETAEGDFLALFNSSGLLEIAINKGHLAELLQLDINSDIRIKFHDR
ncbi:SAM-dependent chlorinase/fluorinase [Labilibaculum sp. DW002]|uniref:SAM-dependent chlorinase/fluorinase n=1 Tax=Paralabilibaculum antarcticum TaxID=2912572 RepID=A0ABT5VWF0_9BACT|nr:SAM-dependent chlorinase/fluorinase [Labilibaculum sp. DW002]MDE5419755.1 SAM-dependent chlorinase/fluorinase [Labilibaculum sp. DW002]